MPSSTIFELCLASGLLGLIFFMARPAFLYPHRMTFYHLVLIFVAVFFGAGTWTAYVSGGLKLPSENPYLLFEIYLVITLYAIGLWISGIIAQQSNLARALRQGGGNGMAIVTFFQRYTRIRWQQVMGMLGCIWTLRIVLGLRYGMLFSGTATLENVLSMPYYVVIMKQLSSTLAYGCLMWGAAAFWDARAKVYRQLGLLVLVSEFVAAFLQGRRWVIIWVVFMFFGFLASGRKITLKYAAVFIGLLFFITSFVFPFFLSIRATFFTPGAADKNVFKQFQKSAGRAYEIADDKGRELSKQSMSDRPLFLHRFIGILCSNLEDNPPMYGDALMRSFVSSIPSAFLPNKYEMLSDEQLMQEHFGLLKDDVANTWPAVGCADFGIAGGIIIGGVLGMWIAFIVYWSNMLYAQHPLVSLSLAAGIIVCLVQVEAGPGICWQLCRDALVIMLIAKGLTIFNLGQRRRASC